MFANLITTALAATSLLSQVATCTPLPAFDTLSIPSLPHTLNRRAIAISALTLPPSDLPAPTDSLALKYVVLGLGTQNYTCADSAPTDSPTLYGAFATLYDVSPLLTQTEYTSAMMAPALPGLALGVSTSPWAAQAEAFLARMGVARLGRHLFDAAGTPTFDLAAAEPAEKLLCAKVASTPAPDTSCRGASGEAAVDWLYLDDAGGSTEGVSAVYRVYTAGGSAPETCADVEGDEIDVDYAAEYWIYGPA